MSQQLSFYQLQQLDTLPETLEVQQDMRPIVAAKIAAACVEQSQTEAEVWERFRFHDGSQDMIPSDQVKIFRVAFQAAIDQKFGGKSLT